MYSVAAARARCFFAFVALFICGVSISGAAAMEIKESPDSELLTNLSQLRHCAAQDPSVVHPFRIVTDVIDVDSAGRVLVLRDASGFEFVRVNLGDRVIRPGSTVCIEGKGCAFRLERFGLAIVPGMVVENDGIHGLMTESGKVFLARGMNPLKLEWFDWFGEFGLAVEYEGPNIPRQRIPSSVLSRASMDAATSQTNFSAGLDFRCYEGTWNFLPDFQKLQPTKIGVTTNFDVSVRSRNDAVAMEFNGFIKILEDGVYTFHLSSDDGARLFIGQPFLEVQTISGSQRKADEDAVQVRLPRTKQRSWVTLEGTVLSAGVWNIGGELVLRVGDDDIRVEIFQGGNAMTDIALHRRVRVTGIYEEVFNEQGERVPGRLLVTSGKSVKPVAQDPDGRESSSLEKGTNAPLKETSTLSTVAQVKALSPELAKRGLPVLIRGVITDSSAKSLVVQDSTRGLYVDLEHYPGLKSFYRGEFCEIEGVTGQGWFAPVVVANRITYLGTGQLPKPVRATRDRVVNGSLDTEFAEIEGVVTAVKGTQLMLLAGGGVVSVELTGFQAEALPRYENAVIRIRGCFFVNFNFYTRKLEVGSLTISGAVIGVLESPPTDFFDVSRRSIGELLFYDPKAAPFRRLKIGGQVIHCRAEECFLTDGTNGVRVTTRTQDHFAVGDIVDAVGILQLGGSAPELRNAVMRKNGHAPLPAPRKLSSDQLFQARNVGTRVQVDAILINHWHDASEQVMELQSGFLAFKARIQANGQSISLPPPGSRLELTGVYAPQGKGRGDGSVSGFDILLSSAEGIRVLAMPPWWTLKRVLILAGVLAAVLCGVLIWNKELHAKVEERSRQLETEIRNRQQAEMQRAAEAERARIARDLHDELGTGLTEVSLLASAGLGQFLDGEKIRDRFHSIAGKSRELVSSLDAIVWAIDSRRNSLQSFADYLAHYARELFSSAAIECRLRIRMERGEIALTEAERHSLFLAVKEALNNVIRHASATELELQISQAGDRLRIVISDNGRGFDRHTIQRGDGLTNLQERLQAMRGECQVESHPEKGTTVEFMVPLPCNPSKPISET